MQRVSIITPTRGRQALLPRLWDCVRAQTVKDIEWLIFDDDSPQPASFEWTRDPLVSYRHEAGRKTIGEKRNDLCAAAKGEIIVHFDDDDYYGPRYIEGMVSFMTEKNADFVKLFGFFLYQEASDTFAYWDLETDFPVHWLF
jgi:glycosyltransferase involved in cell wall biosynthesis